MLPTHEAVTTALHYNEATGSFTWKIRPNPRGPVASGDKAGCVDNRKGYILIRLFGRLHLAHRLAWFYVTGEWPSKQIDHKDGHKGNNAFTNLRDVTNSVNQQNQRRAKRSNKIGLLGVSIGPSGKPRAYITPPDGRARALGTFSTPDDAHAAYLAAKRQLHEGNTL